MKIYGEDSNEKSWAIDMERYGCNDSVTLSAVDAITGITIAKILIFTVSGTVYKCDGVDHALKSRGYNPNQHGNVFETNGALKIT